MAISPERYQAAIRARQGLTVAECPAAASADMRSLVDEGWDGDFVVPNQLSSRSLNGPVILLNNWYGWRALRELEHHSKVALRQLGYLEGIKTNTCLDRALSILRLRRSEVYITQACVFLPAEVTGKNIPDEVYQLSISRVLRLELASRVPVALGNSAQRACRLNGIPFVGAAHPSFQAGERRAQEIADAIKQVL
ncbi:hypothetical protein [Rhodobacter calidifons]|uniref:Uracil DNA glycosylase superfamily protein n=1 Tax=Rhodobacter calidifons TaxID=2715277 RepID=A0ABX0G3K6_9RHOB|nr:hypothetical protein [Rhodobacter calidifons]NHB75451.1 hypothetical protein [Rhodobacter calidifons]